MIPFFIKKYKNEEFNFLDINRYNDSVNNMNSYSIQCNCGCKGSCIKYGKYKRIIDKYEIFIQRVLCKVCKITHAILPTFIVPYERMPLDYILDVVSSYDYVNSADYELKRYKRIYTEWKMRLKIVGIEIGDDINILKEKVFCTDSILLEYSHMDEILETKAKLIEMGTAAFYSCLKIMNKSGMALLLVSDNSQKKKSLVEKTIDDKNRYNYIRSNIIKKSIKLLI